MTSVQALAKKYAISPQQTTQTCKIIFIKAVSFFFLCRSRIGHISPVGIINTLLHLLTLLSCIEWFKAWTSGKTTFSIKLVPNISEVLCRFEFYPGLFFFSVSTISCHSVYLNLPKKSVYPFCSVERSIIITIVKPTFCDGQESVQNLIVYLCIYCSDNECHLLTSVMRPSIINDVGHFLAFFRQSSLYVSLEKHCIKVAAPSPLLVKICAS